jgi:hypothetical protein
MRFHSRFPARLAGLMLALGAAACGGDSTTARPDPLPTEPPPGGLTEGDAVTVTLAVFTGLHFSIAAITETTPSPGGPLSGVVFGIAQGTGLRLSSEAGCPSFEPDPFPDDDGDGVPDRTTFSFDSAACDIDVSAGTVDRRGTFLVSDPGPGPGYDLAFVGVGVTVIPRGGAADEALSSGTRRLRGNGSAVSLEEAVDFRYRRNAVPTFRHRTDWRVDFTAEEPGTITSRLLPDGEFEVQGLLTYEEDATRFDLVVETVAPVGFDSGCTSFERGTVRAYLQGREGEGEVRMTFNGCGAAPTITFVP